LPFADVFLFIGLMPLLAGVMSALLLGERGRVATWMALMAGFIGVMCLFPEGVHSMSLGHLVAFGAAAFGTFSIVMSRYIGRYEKNALAQVFYPNLAVCVTMAIALPFVWTPMPLADLGWVLLYALCLFLARWMLVVALRLLAAYAVTPLMNLQFIWMVVIGAVFFGEYPPAGTYIGSFVVIGSGIFLIWDEFKPAQRARPQRPAA
jgi:drug/metabolite transporter (DMT)-like permease